MIDTHCHIYDEAFDPDREDAIARALDAGVELMLLPSIDSNSYQRQRDVVLGHPSLFRQMAGLHPTSVTDNNEAELALVHDLLFSSVEEPLKPVAVGEIGLDFYWDRSYEAQQMEVLRQQMDWARQLDLPVALHVRKAYNELFALLRQMNHGTYKGVLHCFGGSPQEAIRAVEMGFYIGIGGVVTFKNAGMAFVAAQVPLDRILLETDAPYLAPVPHRGHRNESAYLFDIARTIASVRGITFEEVCQATTENARRLFSL